MPENFGARLRARRERQQIPLATIADQTKIKVSLLEGLERGDVSHWPSGIFRRAFIRTYALAIGLEPDALVAEVGRTARQAASTTGGRVRAAVASAREEKQRREDELWAELSTTDDGAPGVGPGATSATGPDGAATGDPNGAPAATSRPGPHASSRRIRRITRRSPSHLGK